MYRWVVSPSLHYTVYEVIHSQPNYWKCIQYSSTLFRLFGLVPCSVLYNHSFSIFINRGSHPHLLMLVVLVLYASMLLPHFMSRPLVPWCLPYPAHCNQRLTRSITAGYVDLMCNTVRTLEHPCLCLSCVSTYLRMTLQLLVLYNIGLWPACLECIIIMHTSCVHVQVHRPPACTWYSAPGSGSLFYMMCLVIVHIYRVWYVPAGHLQVFPIGLEGRPS